jgi:predicted nucleotidyltransferase
MNDPVIEKIVAALEGIDGVVALVLGGSRARGTAVASSDYDFGLYYDPGAPPDPDALSRIASTLADDASKMTLTRPGEWGPWINGGAWLSVDGHKIDLLYRDLEQVSAVIADCRAGHISMAYQPGHPHGFCSAIWMGEIALCRPLVDLHGQIARLQGMTTPFPAALKTALIDRFGWEIGFSVDNARIAARRSDQTTVAGFAYRALCCASQVLFAINERYLINEKAALSEAAGFPITVEGLADRVAEIWRWIGTGDFARALSILGNLADDIDAAATRARSITSSDPTRR